MIPDYSNLIQEWYTAAGNNADTSAKMKLYDKTNDAISKLNGMGTVQKSEQADIILQTFDNFKSDTASLTQWVASNTDITGNGAYKVIHDLFDTVKNIKGNTGKTGTLTELDKAMTDSIAQSKEKFKNETPPLVDDLMNTIVTDFVQKKPIATYFKNPALNPIKDLSQVSKTTQDQAIKAQYQSIKAYRGSLYDLDIKFSIHAIQFAKEYGSELSFINVSYIHFKGNELNELLEYLPNIKTFIAKGRGLNSEDAKTIAQSANVKNVTTLILAYNKIGAEGVKALLNSPNLENLSILGIWRNGLGFDGAKEIAESKNLLNLKELHVGGNLLGDEGALAIYQAATKSENLTNLDLRSNGFGENIALTISQLEPPRNLEVLNVSFNFIGSEGDEALERSEKLKDVKIEFDFVYGWEDNLT